MTTPEHVQAIRNVLHEAEAHVKNARPPYRTQADQEKAVEHAISAIGKLSQALHEIRHIYVGG